MIFLFFDDKIILSNRNEVIILKMIVKFLKTSEADEIFKNSLVDGVKWHVTRLTDILMYNGKTMVFTPFENGMVKLEIY